MKFDVPSVVINKLFNCGYEEQIIDFVIACEDKKDLEVSDIPLSPTLMTDSGESVILSSKVYNIYLQFVERINNPKTAQEIPFLLVGNKKNIDGKDYLIMEDIIYDMKNALSETHAFDDEQKFRNLLMNEKYSVVSIGHTHGNVAEEIKTKTLARMVSRELKTKYDIRDVGLNVSIADIWQHEAFKQIATGLAPTKEILQTIIMYNGDVIMINPEGISKANDIQTILQDGSYHKLPSGDSEQLMNRQI